MQPAQGRRASFFAALGCTLGIVPHLMATVLGLAAVMHTSAMAFLLNILNPKSTVFFLAFLPQFVQPVAGSPLVQMLGLSSALMAMTFGVFVVYGFLAHAFRRAVIDSSGVQAWLRRGFAAAFTGLGTQLALSER